MARTKSKTESADKLEINLAEFESPHPAILAAYKKANAMDLFFENIPEYVNLKRLKSCSRASGAKIQVKITGIYRKQVGSKEFVFWHQYMNTKDYFGNPIDHTALNDRYTLPEINTPMGINQAGIRGNTTPEQLMQPRPLEIQGLIEVHEFEFEKIKPQLKEWYKQGIIDENTKLYVWALDNRKYAKPYTWDEWIDLDFDSLVLLGQHGRKMEYAFKKGDSSAMLDLIRESIRQEVKTGLNPNQPKT